MNKFKWTVIPMLMNIRIMNYLLFEATFCMSGQSPYTEVVIVLTSSRVQSGSQGFCQLHSRWLSGLPRRVSLRWAMSGRSEFLGQLGDA